MCRLIHMCQRDQRGDLAVHGPRVDWYGRYLEYILGIGRRITRSWCGEALVDRLSRQTFVRVLALTALLCACAMSWQMPQASADPHGYPNPGYVPDDMDHWYCFGAGVTA